MFRIDDATAANALPAPEAAGTEGYFTEGSPGVTNPTLVRASWLNMIQEELRALVVAGGGVPSKTTYNQVLTALRAAGVFQTAAKFDSTTKAATTAFVMAALGSLAGVVSYGGNTTLTSTDVGKLVTVTATSTMTLPDATTIPAGSALRILPSSSAVVTVSSPNGSFIGPNSNGTSSITQNGSVDCLYISNGTVWYSFGGSGLASLASNGYQKFPSGLIIQWGSFTGAGSGVTTTVTFPIAFPNNRFAVSAIGAGANNVTTSVWRDGSVSPTVTTQFAFATNNAGSTVFWIAIGN